MSQSAKRMRIEGVGPKIMAPLFAAFAITAGISYLYRPAFNYPLVPAEWTLALGALFLLVGVPFWLLATGMFLLAYFQGRLETCGPFAIMPNPIYGSWIVLVIPGISLVLNWWPVLLTSVVMYAAQRMFIREEDTGVLREANGNGLKKSTENAFDQRYLSVRVAKRINVAAI